MLRRLGRILLVFIQPSHSRTAQDCRFERTAVRWRRHRGVKPLHELGEHWQEVPESSCLLVIDGQVMVSAFTPEGCF